MNCAEARTRWHRRLDEGRTDAGLEQHLAGCEPCRQYAKQMSRVVGLLDDVRRETEAVVSQTSAPQPRECSARKRRLSLRVGYRVARLAAAVVLLVSGGVLYYATQRVPPGHMVPSDAIVEAPTGTPGEVVGARPDPRIGISLRGQTAEHYLAVAQPTSEPRVQMYWLYPTSLSKAQRDQS